MKKISQRASIPVRQRLIGALCFLFFTGTLSANPQGGQVTAGTAAISNPSATVTEINQQSSKAVIDWHSFNIAPGETTRFIQPGQNAITLNRINPSQGVSQIFGQLVANGRIILVNQAGIFFGPSARVDVAGLIASTVGISNANFMAGNYLFNEPGILNGSVINQGILRAAENGLVALTGTGVQNDGLIEARLGTVILAAGKSFTMDFMGDQLVNFAVNEKITSAGIDHDNQPLHTGVTQTGAIMADGGKILVSVKAAQQVLDQAINMGGISEARSVSVQNGEIILQADENQAIHVSGTLDVSGTDTAEATGGNISASADQIVLWSTARLNAQGNAGGGEILIGGDLHGTGVLPRALQVRVSQDAVLNASALLNGNGGKIVAWADESTGFYGNAIARGGEWGGNGGVIETSGKLALDVSGIHVDLLAPAGKTGAWLLDPTNIVVCDGCTTTAVRFGDTYHAITAITTTNINSGDLGTALNSANITLDTSNAQGTGLGDITVTGTAGLQSNWNSDSTNTLIFDADNDIIFNTDMTLTGTGKTVSLNAAGNITLNNSMNGAFNLTLNAAGNNSTISGTLSQLKTLTKLGNGTLTVSGANTSFSGSVNVNAGTLILTNSSGLGSGTVNVVNGASLSLEGNGLSVGNALTLNGSGVNNAGALFDNSPSGSRNTYTGQITLGSDSTIGVTQVGTTLVITNPLMGNFTMTKTGNGILTLPTPGNTNFPGGFDPKDLAVPDTNPYAGTIPNTTVSITEVLPNDSTFPIQATVQTASQTPASAESALPSSATQRLTNTIPTAQPIAQTAKSTLGWGHAMDLNNALIIAILFMAAGLSVIIWERRRIERIMENSRSMSEPITLANMRQTVAEISKFASLVANESPGEVSGPWKEYVDNMIAKSTDIQDLIKEIQANSGSAAKDQSESKSVIMLRSALKDIMQSTELMKQDPHMYTKHVKQYTETIMADARKILEKTDKIQ